MIVKCTALFELTTNPASTTTAPHRIGGWSESVYDVVGSFGSTTVNAFKEVCRQRARLLPAGAAIVGQRYQIIDPPGLSTTDNTRYPGRETVSPDVPQMALLCKAPAKSASNFKNLILRGIPDARVEQGEYSREAPFTQALNAYFGALDRFFFKARDLTQTAYPLIDILANGTYQTEGSTTLAEGDMVRVLRAENTSERRVGGEIPD